MYMLVPNIEPKKVPSTEKYANFTGLLSAAVIMVALLLETHIVAAGSCGEAQLCCNGRDSSCVVQKTPINAIIEDLNEKPCYCDHACLKLGDCCTDFKEHCGVVDCEVGDWSQWSKCNKRCGTGILTRSREILQPALNGGKRCPYLLQKRNCKNFRCRREDQAVHEIAILLPSQIQQSESEIGKSKRWHDHSLKILAEYGYCIEFEIIKTSKECNKVPNFHFVTEGVKVTVRCPPDANQRRYKIRSPFKKVSHKQQMYDLQKTSKQNNNMEGISNYTTFSEGETKYTDELKMKNNSNNSNESFNQFHYDGTIFSSLNKPKGVATFRSKALKQTMTPLKGLLNHHCRGDGVPGRTTRWRALSSPACRGKWVRLTVQAPEKCKHAQYMFA